MPPRQTLGDDAAVGHLLGIDIGGTKCAAVVGDAGGVIIERAEWPSDAARGPAAMLDDAVRHAAEVVERSGLTVEAAGVAVGGPLDARNGVVLGPPNLPGWDSVPLRDLLEKALSLPVRVEHDAAACALAEVLWGAARGADVAAYLTCGTGFGLGLVVDGRPFYGGGGHSPEIGHVRLRDDGPIAFGKVGSVEAFCAGASLPKLAAWRFPERWGEAPPDGPALAALSEAGDGDARAVIDGWADAVGRVAAAVCDTFFSDVILLGSLARRLGPRVLDRLRSAFAAEALPAAAARCRLELPALGDRLQDCSALAAATRAVDGAASAR